MVEIQQAWAEVWAAMVAPEQAVVVVAEEMRSLRPEEQRPLDKVLLEVLVEAV